MTAPTRLRTSEKVWMAQVIDLARMLGWECYHTHDSRRSTAGFPDLCLVRPPRVVYAELKTETGKTTPAQDHWLDILARSGHETCVWRPSDLDAVCKILARSYKAEPVLVPAAQWGQCDNCQEPFGPDDPIVTQYRGMTCKTCEACAEEAL